MTGKATVEEALEVISQYVEHAIVKIGKKGCLTKVGNEILHVPALDVFRAVDTTGAGDNFLAGVMYGMMQDWDIETCMKMGNIVGGYSTTELGCSKAHLTLDKAIKYLKLYE
jgi:ribokinase